MEPETVEITAIKRNQELTKELQKALNTIAKISMERHELRERIKELERKEKKRNVSLHN